MEVQKILLEIEKRKDECLHRIKMENDYAMFTLADACRKSGESYPSIRRILRSPNPTLSSLGRVAKVLEVTLPWLLTGNVLSPEWRGENGAE
jgi:transcriptional regulator with XRE-family HTH domain|tara:strand:- start:1343 stop:1618 length:276 start_codon:yes stop_codon:yes gene_type:complete